MKRKATKVEKSISPHTANKQAKAAASKPKGENRQIRYVPPEQAQKAMEKIFRVHHELFRKLAQ